MYVGFFYVSEFYFIVLFFLGGDTVWNGSFDLCAWFLCTLMVIFTH